MSIGMLGAGIACLLAGLLAIGFGIPINEFGLGNTLILAGAVTACTGLIILGLWVVVRELKNLSGGLGVHPALDVKPRATAALPRPNRDSAAGEPNGSETSGEQPPMSTEQDASQSPAPEEPPLKQRRNLMFSSTSRRERERAHARGGEQVGAEPQSGAAAAPAVEISEPSPGTFEDAWPKSERTRPADAPGQRRARTPPTFDETGSARQAPPTAGADRPAVTVLKSGVVDGMAYSLYSDGSIEAQMPEGMMRFASIDELRAHLDQRP
jgi:hypothetical protein